MLPSTSQSVGIMAQDNSAEVGFTPMMNGGDPNMVFWRDDYLQGLINEMRAKDFDSIRFASYRTASKLRFVQSRTNVHLVDIYNMIESFRENGLNARPNTSHLKTSRLELLLTSVFHNLNKRLPISQQIDTDRSIALLLHFLLSAYDRQSVGRVTIFAIKVALTTLCVGKLVDKMKYIFSQMSDPSGHLIYEQFVDYLQQILALPTAMFEGPTFGFSETAIIQCFRKNDRVGLPQFLDSILGDSCPPCLIWLPLFHRMAAVEHVYHPVACDTCQVRSFTGFRYKCQRCVNYQLCQSCFWRGRTSKTHSNEHEMKEYSSYKSPTKQMAHSIQKSLQCIPVISPRKQKTVDPHRRSHQVNQLDLVNIVPGTPNQYASRHQPSEPINDWTSNLLPGQYGQYAMDDEHKLIARYAAKLAGRTVYSQPYSSHGLSSGRLTNGRHSMADERALIASLEEENTEMLRELSILEQQQLDLADDTTGQLKDLRTRTSELENRMREKQHLRRELMTQLEQLMTQLNSPLISEDHLARMYNLGMTSSTIPTAGVLMTDYNATGVPATHAQLQESLLHAADDITTKVAKLVQELDMEDERNEEEEDNLPENYVNGRNSKEKEQR